MSDDPPQIPQSRPFDVLSDRHESGKSLSDFLHDEVFGRKITNEQDQYDAEAVNRLTHKKQPEFSEQNQGSLFNLVSAFQGFLVGQNKDDSKQASVLNVAQNFIQQKNESIQEKSNKNDMNLFWALLKEAKNQWGTVAESAKVKELDPFALMYFLGLEESLKTPSFKLREHRFYPSLEIETLYDLHDCLYLATISYMNTVQDITEALEEFHGSPWVMVFCEVTSKPHQPAHFICLKREQEHISEGFRFPWQEQKALDVLLVVRGTKEIPDVLSDALIKTEPFNGGLAHGGIQTSGKYLVDKHTPLLKELLKESKCGKIRLSLVGHSLGAGAAAIACMEFNKLDFVEAKAVGFGCPPVLSKELSESTKDYITTVVCDSDAVPRMSGATISNVLMKVMSQSYTEMALVDVEQVIRAVEENTFIKASEQQKRGIVDYIKKEVDDDFERRKVDYEPQEVVLFPPGKCIHLFRDGVGISGSYVPWYVACVTVY